MNESGYTQSVLKKLRPAAGVSCVWKVSANFADGVPDCFIEGTERDMWLEVKYCPKLPVKAPIDLTNSKYLSKLQQSWLKRRNEVRGDAWVLLGYHHDGKNYGYLTQDFETPIDPALLRSATAIANDIAKHIMLYVTTTHYRPDNEQQINHTSSR